MVTNFSCNNNNISIALFQSKEASAANLAIQSFSQPASQPATRNQQVIGTSLEIYSYLED